MLLELSILEISVALLAVLCLWLLARRAPGAGQLSQGTRLAAARLVDRAWKRLATV